VIAEDELEALFVRAAASARTDLAS
jgi:hypothetical protein